MIVMIIYKNTKQGFLDDVRDNIIANKIEDCFKEKHIPHNNHAEYMSWMNSLNFMRNVLDDQDIDGRCEIAIEYQVPYTSKRVDFLISGENEASENNVVVVELKQWENCTPSKRPDVVSAFTGGAERAVVHPSYQAYSYCKIIESFNEEVKRRRIGLRPCAYLHNFPESNRPNIDSDFYKDAIELAPIFLQKDTAKLRSYIKRFVRKEGKTDLLYAIENGKLKPSKSLQDSLASMMHNNEEFVLIDEQKVVYESVKRLVEDSLRKASSPLSDQRKYTLICQGGPGSGKSVLAINLLVEAITKGYSASYVTKNAAPRNVYFRKLQQSNYKTGYVKALFQNSGAFVGAKENTYDLLLADEAHRLALKSGLFANLGESQIKEIIHASRVSVFFIDPHQRVTTADHGSLEEIRKRAKEEGSVLVEGNDLNLVSQFRCNGSDGYLAYLDAFFGFLTPEFPLPELDYDIRFYRNPVKMREDLRKKNEINDKCRMLAGYCYEWITKNNPDAPLYDIVLPYGFRAKWNFGNTGTWAIDPDSFDQVGCIHTSQGLEFDTVGVIIGPDLIYRNGKVETDFRSRADSDKSLKGIKTTKNYALADEIIRNTYRTLLTRGMKGCYVYCEDNALLEYMASYFGKNIIE